MKDKISIVTSLYRSSPYIKDFYLRHLNSLKAIGVEYEFIFVNDGSPDDSAQVVRSLMETEPFIKLIDFSRNFGQHAAMFAGMDHASGTYIWALDSDLEEAPENIQEFYKILSTSPELDVVYGVLEQRSGSFQRKILGSLFYTLMDTLSEVKIPRDQAWQRLMKPRYVEALLSFTESSSLPAGLMILAGFNQKPIQIDKKFKGQSSYNFKKRIRLALNSIVAFSSRPLILISLAGFVITLISFISVLVIISYKLISTNYQAGWASVVASIWFVGGMILSALGVIGLYVAKIFNQTKGRPQYIIKGVHSSGFNNDI